MPQDRTCLKILYTSTEDTENNTVDGNWQERARNKQPRKETHMGEWRDMKKQKRTSHTFHTSKDTDEWEAVRHRQHMHAWQLHRRKLHRRIHRWARRVGRKGGEEGTCEQTCTHKNASMVKKKKKEHAYLTKYKHTGKKKKKRDRERERSTCSNRSETGTNTRRDCNDITSW